MVALEDPAAPASNLEQTSCHRPLGPWVDLLELDLFPRP